MTILHIVRGMPGSGKSTFAKTLDLPHFEADMYFVDKETGIYTFWPQRIGEAHDWCQNQVFLTLDEGKDCVVSNTFTRMMEVQRYVEIALQLKADFIVYRCIGDYGSVHNVPEETLEKMRNRFADWAGERYIGQSTT